MPKTILKIPATLTATSPLRDGVGEALLALGRQNPDVVVLTADLAESTRCHLFAKAFPERFFQVGVAEQNMMGVAAGMALAGKIPYVCSFAVFSPGRNWDQLRVSVCYSEANVKIIGSHAGFSNGGDGGTHQALEDIAITRCLPNLAVISPADAAQTYEAVMASSSIKGPVYIRVSRAAPYTESSASELIADHPFTFGKVQVLRQGNDVTLLATGLMVAEAIKASEVLADQGITAEVLNVHTIKPLDTETIIHSLKKTGAAVTMEEHQRAGGMGSAVLEALSGESLGPIELLAVTDQFGESGPPPQIAKKHHLTAEVLAKTALQVMKRRDTAK